MLPGKHPQDGSTNIEGTLVPISDGNKRTLTIKAAIRGSSVQNKAKQVNTSEHNVNTSEHIL
jgi:hypothetical protein